jgi:hypothetical protein
VGIVCIGTCKSRDGEPAGPVRHPPRRRDLWKPRARRPEMTVIP